MLETVLILNLKKRVDKWMFAQGALRAHDFDIESNLVHRFLGHDGETYESREAVMEAAVADGFDYFGNYEWMNDKRSIAWCWSWAAIMRKIVEIDKTTMFLMDDQMPIPGWSYWRFCRLVEDLHDVREEHGELRVIQLNTGLYPKSDTIVYPMVGQGIGGSCDFGFILTAAGAQLLLDVQSTPIHNDKGLPWDFPCVDMRRMCEQKYDFDCTTGVYHMLDHIVTPEHIEFKSDLRDY